MNPILLNRRTALTFLVASLALQGCGKGNAAIEALLSQSDADRLSAPSLARAALIHDALLLLASDEDLTGQWQDMLLPLPVGKPFEFSYAYGVASLKDDGQLAIDIAQEVRSNWADRDAPFMDIQRHKGEMIERRLSVALGWAANHVGAPLLFDGLDPKLSAAAFDGAFVRAIMGVDQLNQAHAASIVRLMFERTFIAMHTLEPDLDGWGGLGIASMHEVQNPNADDINRFIDDYVDWVEQIDARAQRLGAAMAHVPEGGMLEGALLYDTRDPIVAAVEALRSGYGRSYPPGYWAQNAGSSRYAIALAYAHGAARHMLDVARGERALESLSELTA